MLEVGTRTWNEGAGQRRERPWAPELERESLYRGKGSTAAFEWSWIHLFKQSSYLCITVSASPHTCSPARAQSWQGKAEIKAGSQRKVKESQQQESRWGRGDPAWGRLRWLLAFPHCGVHTREWEGRRASRSLLLRKSLPFNVEISRVSSW